MKILSVCGFGVGSSLVLKMNLEKAFKNNGINDVEITTSDVSSIGGNVANAIFTSEELADQVRSSVKDLPVIVINNFVNHEEIDEKVKNFLKEMDI